MNNNIFLLYLKLKQLQNENLQNVKILLKNFFKDKIITIIEIII